MKSLIKIISSFLLLSLAGINLNAQSPQKMSFQAVIRNASNAIVSLGPIGMRISIVQGTATGQAVYVETQNAITNTNGLVSLQIGTGKIVAGSFSSIDWANGSYFIKTETDPNGGADYSIIGSSELLSVPYALFAANVDIHDYLGTSSDQISLSLLKIGQVLNINMTKGVRFGTNGHIIVATSDENHFEGTFNSYNATTGILVITISKIIGAITHNYWTVKVNDSRGYNGIDGLDGIAGTRGLTGLTGLAGTDGTNGTDGTRGLTGLTGLAGADGLNGTIGVDGINGIDGLQGIAGAKGDIGETGAAGLDAVNGEPLITGGTISQYFRGDKTWQTLNTTAVEEGLNKYFTDARARLSISVGTGLAYDNTTGIISAIIPQGSGSVNGLIYSADWNTFNNKQNALGFTPYNAINPDAFIKLTDLSSGATGLTYNNTTGTFSLTSTYFIPNSTNLSGSNMGDESAATIKTKLGITTLSGSNTGDQILPTLSSLNGETALATGTTTQYYRGDKTWQTLNSNAVEEGLNKYFTDARARLAISVGSGLAYDNNTGIISTNVPQGSGSVNGLIYSTDWNTFNNKQNALGYIPYNATNPDAFIKLYDLSSNATGLTYNNTTGTLSLATTYFIPNSSSLYGVNTGDQVLPTLSSLNAEPSLATGTITQYYRGDKTWQTLNHTAVGIENATTFNIGLIQLAGDLTGTASLPRIAIDAIKSSNILNLNVTDNKIESVSGVKILGDISGNAANINGIISIANGGTGVTNIVDMKLSYGLEHINNISDADKPISIATQNALNLKSTINAPTFTGIVSGITSEMIGLGFVNNTTDINKPLSTASIASFLLKENSANKSISGLLGISNILYPTQNAVKTYVDVSINNATVPNASALVLGKLRLGGDLNGFGSSAEAPIISDLAITANKIADGNITDQKIVTVNGSKISGNISGNAANISGILAISNGGTGANTAASAKLGLGLDNVNNTSDANKEISVASSLALGLKANLFSPSFSGTVSSPNFSGELTGNASTATILSTPRTINGISFNGSENIIITDNTRILNSEKAANNGVATLDGSGKVLISQLPVGTQSFKGTWNASINTPSLANGTGSVGWTYIVSIAGTQNLGTNNIVYNSGDNVIYNGTIWELSPNAASVVSVNNQQGAILLSTTDIAEGSNAYFTNARSRSAMSSNSPILYNSTTGVFSSQLATIAQNGYLSASDWNLFNSKQNAGNFITPISIETLTNKTLTSPVINTPTGINKNDIGLNNVANTADNLKNVLTATKLLTARTINGISFDGSSNIDISDPTKISIIEKAAINGVATLDGFGKIPASQMSSIAISTTFVIASEIDMLALSQAQKGDIAVRTDLHTTFILVLLPASNVSNWQELLTPLATVQNVNGRTGNVTLSTNDIAEGTNLYYTAARVSGKEPTILTGTISQYYRGDKTWQTLNALTVGLDNVDNTADFNKSTYSASKLTTPRNINGISFDGSHDITITAATNDATNLVKGRILLGGDLNGIGSSSLTPIISANAIINEKIADNAISTSKILDENVTDAKILSISGSKIIGNISGKASNITGILTLANGGTGANNAADAKAAIGLSNIDNTSDLNKPISTATTAFVLANSDHYNSISAGNEIFTTSSSDVLATGLSFTPPAGKYFVNFNSQYTIEPADRTGQAQIDLTAVYANLMARTVTNATHGVGYGAGETLSPGVYNTAGAVTTTGTLTLDAGGDPNAEFVFQFGAALSTGAGFKIILTNGATACNVYWIAEGAIALGAATEMKGMLISNSGAVSLGSTSNVQGSLFSSGGAIGIDASTVSRIPGCANNFGSIKNYAVFSKTGTISNAGASSITGDIASNAGTVTGFGSATINGSIYTSGVSNANANFSVYQNGILIPYSTRNRTSTLNIGEITLQAIATIGNGENIEIKWNIDLGKVKMQNRIFTIQYVR